MKQGNALFALPHSPHSSEQTLVGLLATQYEGLAFAVLPACEKRGGPRRARTLALPRMSSHQVEAWLVRRNEFGQVLGGFQLAVSQMGIGLLCEWIGRLGAREQEHTLLLPLQEVADMLPEAMITLRQAMCWMVEGWRSEADVLSGGGIRQQEVAGRLRKRLALPLGVMLEQGILESELPWFWYEAELEWLMPQLSKVIMIPLREWLNELGLTHPLQPISLLPLDQIGRLPLHTALVSDPRSGKQIPFQETCRLKLCHGSS